MSLVKTSITADHLQFEGGKSFWKVDENMLQEIDEIKFYAIRVTPSGTICVFGIHVEIPRTRFKKSVLL